MAISLAISLTLAALLAGKRKRVRVQLAHHQTTTADTSELVKLDGEEARSLRDGARNACLPIHGENTLDAAVDVNTHVSSAWSTDSDSDVD